MIRPDCARCVLPAVWRLDEVRVGAGVVVEPWWACTRHAIAVLADFPGLTLVPVEAALRQVDRARVLR